MATITALDIISTIRDNATQNFIDRVPEVTRENLSSVGQAITKDKNIMNEFVTALIDKIAISSIKSKMYKNPLAKLKTGSGRPLGNTIEEIFINPSTDMGYQNDGTYLLKTSKPDGKACYYGLNRQSCYPTTIKKPELQRAFSSERSFMNFYNAQINALYSGDNIDEFELAKGVFGKNIADGHIKFCECDISNPKELCKAITNMSNEFTFVSTEFNGYNLVNADKFNDNNKKCQTFCPIENQVLLIRADVETEINYEVLASMFHMELASLKTMTIRVNNFNVPTYAKKDVYAVLCDINAINLIDDVFETDSQYIGSSMDFNVWLHHWEWLYLSMFGNCVAFGKTVATEPTP